MRGLGASALAFVAALGCISDAVIAQRDDGALGPAPLTLVANFSGQCADNAAAEAVVTSVSVTLRLDQRPVDDATVWVAATTEEHALRARGGGAYSGVLTGWSERWSVRVARGSATLWNGTIASIGAHRFPALSPEMRVGHDAPLELAWAPSGAPEAWIESPGPLRVIEDTGHAQIAQALFPVDDIDLLVRLVRAQTVALDALAPGSNARFQVSNEVELNVR